MIFWTSHEVSKELSGSMGHNRYGFLRASHKVRMGFKGSWVVKGMSFSTAI